MATPATEVPDVLPGAQSALTLGFVEATDRLNRGFLSLALLYGIAAALFGLIIAPFNRYDHHMIRSIIIGVAAVLVMAVVWQQREVIRTRVSDRPSWLLVGVFIGVATLWADTGWRSSYYLFSYAVVPVAAVLASRRWGVTCGLLVVTGYLGGLVVHGYSWAELGELRDQDSIVANCLGYPLSALFFSAAFNRFVGFVARINQIVGQQADPREPAVEAAEPPERLRTKGLTPREVQVVQLVAIGLTNDQVAERLVVSPRTVHSHVGNALRKTKSANRTELGLLAVREGLVPMDSAGASAVD